MSAPDSGNVSCGENTKQVLCLDVEGRPRVETYHHDRVVQDLRRRLDKVEAERDTLRKCVEAADEMRGAMTDLGGCYDVRSNYVDNFDAARKDLP